MPGGMIVIQRYDVYDNGIVAGTVILGRRGLYYAVSCRCDPGFGRGKRLMISGDRGKIDLGRLYKIEGIFGLETSVTIKKVGEGPYRFALEDTEPSGSFVELNDDKPFAYLNQLEHCKFAVSGGKPGLILPSKKLCRKR